MNWTRHLKRPSFLGNVSLRLFYLSKKGLVFHPSTFILQLHLSGGCLFRFAQLSEGLDYFVFSAKIVAFRSYLIRIHKNTTWQIVFSLPDGILFCCLT